MLILIIFLILLYNIVMTLLGKVDMSRTYCGIVAYCGDKPADPLVLRIMLMYNNSRGGDSTGWAINNQITKDTKTVADFLKSNKMIISPEDVNYTVIAHARKSSSGLKGSRDHAHPIGMYKGGVEGDLYDIILAMNGTFSNEEAFAEEFGFKWQQNKTSDTEMLTRVMCDLGPKNYIKALEGYAGTCTLVFCQPRNKNTLLVYRDPLRELYYYKPSETEIYISSMKEAFQALNVEDEDIKEFENNHLYKIVKGKVVADNIMKRTPLYKAPVSTSTNYSRNAAWNDTSRNRSTVGSTVGSGADFYNLDVTKLEKGGDKVYLLYDKYLRNYHTITGKFFLDDEGSILSLKTGERPDMFHTFKPYFFINGYMTKDEASYDELHKKLCDNRGEIIFHAMQDMKSSDLIKYMKYPIMTIGTINDKEKWWILPEDLQKEVIEQDQKDITITHFLSEYEIILSPANRRLKVSKIPLFELKSHKPIKKSILTPTGGTKESEPAKPTMEMLKGVFPMEMVEKFVQKTIKEQENLRAPELYDMSRIYLFRMQGGRTLEDFLFGEVLLNMLLESKVADLNDVTFIRNAAREKGWFDHLTSEKLGHGMTCLKEHYKEEDGDIEDAEFTDISELDVRERIKAAKFNPTSQLSFDESLVELKLANSYFSLGLFSNEMSAPCAKTFEEFAGKFINLREDNDEMVELSLAVFISLREKGVITNKQLRDFVCMEDVDMLREAKMYYEMWFNKCLEELIMVDDKKNEGDEDVDDSTNFHDPQGDRADLEDRLGGNSDIMNEVNSDVDKAEENENEMEDMLSLAMESLESLAKDCKLVPDAQSSPRIKEIAKEVMEVHKYLKDHLYDRERMNTVH